MKKRLLFELNIKNIILIIVFSALNVGLFFLSKYLQLPFWLDTIGTMAAAVELGAAAGVLSAVGSSAAVWLISGNSLVYCFAAIMTAVIVGLFMTGNKLKDKLFTVFSIFAAFFILRIIRAFPGEKHGKASKITAGAAAIVLALCSVTAASVNIRAEAQGFDIDYETVVYSSKDGLSNSSVNAVAQTNDGYLWVGTYAGLYMYDGIKFDEVKIHESIRTVKELFVDSKGRLWIGSNDSGIVCYDPADGSSKLFNTANGLDSDSIRAICEGSDGCIYVGTALSFSKITPDDVVKTYNEWKNVVHVQSLVSFDDGVIVGVTNGGTLFLEKNDLLISTEKCSTEGSDFRIEEKTGNILYVGC